MASLKVFEYKKNQIVLDQGQVCNYLYFVDQGLLRLFYYRDGKDVTDYFATEQNLIGGIDSFFSRLPSKKIIETLEPCKLTAISHSSLERLYTKYHNLEKAGRILAISAFLSLQERLYAIQFQTAKERYDELVSNKPDLLRRASLGQIASYLGITQVTLSRVRGQ